MKELGYNEFKLVNNQNEKEKIMSVNSSIVSEIESMVRADLEILSFEELKNVAVDEYFVETEGKSFSQLVEELVNIETSNSVK
jgi:hypothetical protein